MALRPQIIWTLYGEKVNATVDIEQLKGSNML